jgi:excisionase family DNA binding protein
MELLTIKQAATVFKIHPLTVRRYIKEGKLTAVKVAGNIRIRNQDLKSLIETFVPQTRIFANKTFKDQTIKFDTRDPLFRLKGKVISYVNSAKK